MDAATFKQQSPFYLLMLIIGVMLGVAIGMAIAPRGEAEIGVRIDRKGSAAYGDDGAESGCAHDGAKWVCYGDVPWFVEHSLNYPDESELSDTQMEVAVSSGMVQATGFD